VRYTTQDRRLDSGNLRTGNDPTQLHPRNSNLASAQSGLHGPPMHDFKRELRAIRDRLAKQDVSIQDWASAADVSHTTLWRILERGQTPSVSTYQALICAEKKFAPMQK